MDQEIEQLLDVEVPPPADVTSSSLTRSSQPTSIQFQNTWSFVYDKFNSKLAKKLGVTQLVVGGIAMLLNVTGMVMYAMLYKDRDDSCCVYGKPYKIASGIWGAVFFGLSGGFSLRAAQKKTQCNIMTTMVTTLLSLVVAAVIVAMACWAITIDIHRVKRAHRENGPNPSHERYYGYFEVSPLEAGSGLAVSVMFLAAGIALVVTCCRTVVILAKVIRCGSQSIFISKCGDSLMQVVDSEGQPIPGARIIRVQRHPAATAHAHFRPGAQLITPADGAVLSTASGRDSYHYGFLPAKS